jgi:hypothetical protein
MTPRALQRKSLENKLLQAIIFFMCNTCLQSLCVMKQTIMCHRAQPRDSQFYKGWQLLSKDAMVVSHDAGVPHYLVLSR